MSREMEIRRRPIAETNNESHRNGASEVREAGTKSRGRYAITQGIKAASRLVVGV